MVLHLKITVSWPEFLSRLPPDPWCASTGRHGPRESGPRTLHDPRQTFADCQLSSFLLLILFCRFFCLQLNIFRRKFHFFCHQNLLRNYLYTNTKQRLKYIKVFSCYFFQKLFWNTFFSARINGHFLTFSFSCLDQMRQLVPTHLSGIGDTRTHTRPMHKDRHTHANEREKRSRWFSITHPSTIFFTQTQTTKSYTMATSVKQKMEKFLQINFFDSRPCRAVDV
jgi:hypothetical protein